MRTGHGKRELVVGLRGRFWGLNLGLYQLGQPRNEQRHTASFIPGQILGHHWHLPVVLAVDIGDEVLVAVVDPIAPGVSVTVHGGVETAPSRWTPVGIGKDGNLATGPSLPALP